MANLLSTKRDKYGNFIDEEKEAEKAALEAQRTLGQKTDETIDDALVSGADTASFGLLPSLAGWLNQSEGLGKALDAVGLTKDKDAKTGSERVELARERSPIASTVGDIGGAILPGAAIGGTLARGVAGLAKPTLGRIIAKEGLTAGIQGGIDEGVRSSLDPEREFNPARVVSEGVTGAAGAGLLGGIGRQLFSPKAAIRARAGTTKGPLAATAADPTGTIPDVGLSGPESLFRSGMAPEAQKLQKLHEGVQARAPGGPTAAEIREPALQRGSDVLQQNTDLAAAKSQAANEGATRMPAAAYGMPHVDAQRAHLVGPGLVSGNAKDSAEAWMKTMADMKANKAITPQAAMPQLDQDIALLTQRLGAPGKAPHAIAAEAGKATQDMFGGFRQGLEVPSVPPSRTGSIMGGAQNVANMFGPKGRAVGAGIGAARSLGGDLVNGVLPTLRPNAVRGLLDDPAKLAAVMAPDTYMGLIAQAAGTQAFQQTGRQSFKAIAEGRGEKRRNKELRERYRVSP